MSLIRVVAITTKLAEAVRTEKTDPQFGFPVYSAPAGEGLPCRHCLDWIAEGAERATLFTLDPFADLEKLPLPGPVYIHAGECERYPENGDIPMRLMTSPRTLNAYRRGRRLVAQEYVDSGNAEAALAASREGLKHDLTAAQRLTLNGIERLLSRYSQPDRERN